MKAKLEISTKQPTHSLDTLELTLDYCVNKNHAKQYYKALRKKKTILKIQSIIDAIPNEPIAQKRYWKTYHCNNIILQENDNLQVHFVAKGGVRNVAELKPLNLQMHIKNQSKQSDNFISSR